jgi:hypothetical protein
MVTLFSRFFLHFLLVLDFTRLLFLTGPNFPAGSAALRCLLAHSLTSCVVVLLDIKRLLEAFYPSVRSSVRPSVGVCCCWWVSFCCEFCVFWFGFCFVSFSLQLCLQTSSRLLLLTRNTQLDREETQREKE